MILTRTDVDELIEQYSDYQLGYGLASTVMSDPGDDATERFYGWIANNPQAFMASGFQEYVGAYRLSLYKRMMRDGSLIKCRRAAFRKFEGQWILISDVSSDRTDTWEGFSLELLRDYRSNLSEYGREKLHAEGELDYASVVLPSFDEIIANAEKVVNNGQFDTTTFVSPKLWTPSSQRREKDFLRTTAVSIIKNVQQEGRELDSISWSVFEELVAEILRSRGMEIHLVRESPQGGRDIIARGELIPGVEPITLAVEVKHQRVVDRPEVQKALHQNRYFPALLFVTSGRFTAGVIQEARLPENRMRLFLKDGVAIRELIRSYRFLRK